MRKLIWFVALALSAAVAAASEAPMWAFFVPDAVQPATAPDTGAHGLPGSQASFTRAQVDNLKSPPDWFPAEHGTLPPAVGKGGAGRAFACNSCHLSSGMGHPESSSLAGQPAAYLDRQMAEFRSGARSGYVDADGKPLADTVAAMVALAQAWPAADAKAATDFYAAMKPRPWIKVVETTTVPESYVSRGYMRVPAAGGQTEPLGTRLVELPQDLDRALLRDPRSGAVTYVPKGAIARGKLLAAGGAAPCSACHGTGLKGAGDVPGLAGRSPTYNFRQLLFFKRGNRNGSAASLMKSAVAGLSDRDMIDLSAYLGSLPN